MNSEGVRCEGVRCEVWLEVLGIYSECVRCEV